MDRSRFTRWLTRGAIAAFLLVAAGLAVFAFQSMRGPLDTPIGAASPSAAPCSPVPCLDVQGYTLWVSNVSVAGDLVRMTIRFKNSSDSTHASPDDLTLIDGSHHSSRIVTDGADCNTWPRHEFDNGATFGPIDVCFKVTNTSPPFTLRWTPDLGFFCCETQLPISPT